MIEIRGLAKSYGQHRALQDVSLSIRPGEFVVVLGPSGAGKSTLLRCINRLIEPSAGDILVDGASLSSNRRDLRLLRRYERSRKLALLAPNTVLDGLQRLFAVQGETWRGLRPQPKSSKVLHRIRWLAPSLDRGV